MAINMSYCRFQNTLDALRECNDDGNWDDLSPEEKAAAKKLVRLCRTIAEEIDEETI